MRWFAVAVMFVEPAASSSCNCNAACVDSIIIDVLVDTSSFPTDAITVCKNGDCATGIAGSASGELTGAFVVDVELEPTRLQLEIEDAAPYADGDLYTVDIMTTDGSPVVSLSGSASYGQDEICGTHCATLSLEL